MTFLLVGFARSARESAAVSAQPSILCSMSRSCARPTCSVSAAATMSYDYESQVVWIEGLHPESHPMTHDLCAVHADRSTPPKGWELRDERAPRGIYALHAS